MASPAIQDLGGSRWSRCFAQAPSSIADTAYWRPAGISTHREASLTTIAERSPPWHKIPPPLLSPQEVIVTGNKQPLVGLERPRRRTVSSSYTNTFCRNATWNIARMDVGARQSPWRLATKQNSNSEAHHINRIEMKQEGFTSVGQTEGYKPTVEF